MKSSTQNLLSIREWQTHREVYRNTLDHGVDWGARLPARFRNDPPGWGTLPNGERHFMVERKPWPTRRDFYGALGLWPDPHKPSHRWSWVGRASAHASG